MNITKEVLYEHLGAVLNDNCQIDKAVFELKDECLSFGVTENIVKHTTIVTIEISEIIRDPK